MAAQQRPSFGIRHLTVVPTNFEGEKGKKADDADGSGDH